MDTLLHLGLSNAGTAAVLAVAVAAVARVCRRPAVLHSLWLLVLLKLLTPPFLAVPLPWPSPLEPTAAPPPPPLRPEAALGRPLDGARILLPLAADPVAPAPRRQDPPPAPAAVPEQEAPLWKPAVLAVWLAGALLCWAVAAVRIARFRRLLRQAAPAPAAVREQARVLAVRLGLARCPRVVLVEACVSPLLWALGPRPCLLLPAALWGRLAPEQRDTLLAHELAHLRRRDHWVRRLELIVLGLYWWHPVAWWARRRLAEAEEECCDAWVVWALPDAAPAYAAALIETVAFLARAARPVPAAASGIGHVQSLKRRLIMILHGSSPRALTGAGALAVLGLGALLLPLLPTWAQQPSANPPSELRGTTAAAPPAQEKPAAKAKTQKSPPLPKAAQDVPPDPDAARPAAKPPRVPSAWAEELEKAREDVELLEAQLGVKRAQFEAVQLALRQAKVALERVQDSHEAGAISEKEFLRARLEVAALEAQVLVKQAELREPEVRLRHARRRLAALTPPSAPPAPPDRATTALAKDWPAALFDSLSTELATNLAGAVLKCEFRLVNKMNTPVRISSVRSSAGFARVSASPSELDPKQAGAVAVTVDTSRFTGTRNVSVYVQFDRPVAGQVRLEVRVRSGPSAERGKLQELEKKFDELRKELESLRKQLPQGKAVPKGAALSGEVLLRTRTFEIPLQVEEKRRGDLQRLILHCSTDEGETWEEVASVTPDARSFRYSAPADGVYWFRVAAEERGGERRPPTFLRSPPELKVRVQTR